MAVTVCMDAFIPTCALNSELLPSHDLDWLEEIQLKFMETSQNVS